MTTAHSFEIPVPPTRKAILCVCHDSDMLEVRRMLLEHFGYTVLPSTNIEDAKSVAADQCPDLLLMDNCDSSLDYNRVAEQVKAVCPDVIAVLLSPLFRLSVNGDAGSIDRLVAQDDGPGALMDEINELLGGAPEQQLQT
jgi:CheY-like chemotaxis protein